MVIDHFDLKRLIVLRSPFEGAVGDFNHDGYLDVVFSQSWHDTMSVFLGCGNGTFKNPMISSVAGYPLAIIAEHFNDDSHLDIAVASVNWGSISIFLGYGDGTFSSGTFDLNDIQGSPMSLTTGDFNNDGWLDIVVGMPKEQNIGIFVGYGNGTFLPFATYLTKSVSTYQNINADDFNNDGRLDIITT